MAMKIILAVDGSKCTGKSLAFLLKQPWVRDPNGEVVAINVQARLASRSLPNKELMAIYKTEAEAVLQPVERMLRRNDIACRVVWRVGYPAAEIVKLAKKERAQLIVMGTRGRGTFGRLFMGSVAQRVVSVATVPVLLVK